MKTLIRLIYTCFMVWPAIAAAQNQPLGKGILRVDMNLVSALDFFGDPSCDQLIHKVSMQANDVGVIELREANVPAAWLVPEQFHPSYDIFMLRVDSMTNSAYRVFINNSERTAWIKIRKGLDYLSWEQFLTRHTSSIHPREGTIVQIRSQPQTTSRMIRKTDRGDCFKVKALDKDWIQIESDGDCSESETPVRSGWIQWKKNNRLQVSYSLIL